MEADDDGDGEPLEEGITCRELVSVLLLDMERSLDGLSSYRKGKDKCDYRVSYSVYFTIRLC